MNKMISNSFRNTNKNKIKIVLHISKNRQVDAWFHIKEK